MIRPKSSWGCNVNLYPNQSKYLKHISVWRILLALFIVSTFAYAFGWNIYLHSLLALFLSVIILSILKTCSLLAYFRKHPLKNYHTFYIRKVPIRSCLILAFLLIGSLSLTIYCFFKPTGTDISGLGVISGLVFMLLLLLTPDFIEGLNYVAIYPYFEKPVGDIHTYGSGVYIARRINILDKLADDAELPQMSSFGYKDSWKNAELKWYDASDVLPTITLLLDTIKKNPETIDDADNITHDLIQIHSAISKAEEQDTRFCFVMNFCGFTNAMEHERREGSFF